MKAVILAARQIKNGFDRSTITVNGETLVNRSLRLLKQNGIADLIVSVDKIVEGQYGDDVQLIANPLTGNDMGCIYGIKEPGVAIYLFGDVYFSENAITTIVNGTTNYYGKLMVGGGGEMLAFKSSDEFWKNFDLCWEVYKQGKIPRLWSWDLRAYQVGSLNLQKPPATAQSVVPKQSDPQWTSIDDETVDFDNEEQFIKWRNKWQLKL